MRIGGRLAHPLVLATVVVAGFRLALIPFLTHPGYTDAYYYFIAARRLAGGLGLTTDVVLNFMEAPGFAPLPIASHRFWMPLATALQSAGIALFGWILDPLRAAELAVALVAIAIVPATYLLARRVGASVMLAAVAAIVAGVGGIEGVAWSSLDNFAPLAVLGTLLLAALPGVASGRRRDVLIAGLALGGIVLARADGPIYAIAPLVLARRNPRAAAATLALGALVALPWYLRNAALGIPDGQLARAALLVRYEEFFAIAPPTLEHFLASLGTVLRAKADALGPDLGTLLFATSVVLGPLAFAAAWRRRREPIAAGFLAVMVTLFLAQWLVFTLHGTRGSLSHSLAGLVPAALVLGLVEGGRYVLDARRFAGLAMVGLSFVLAITSLAQWKSAFDPDEAAREADAAAGVVSAPILTTNAPAWAYAAGGAALVTPADGLDALREVARRYGARTLVLGPGHFSAYDGIYDGTERLDWLQPVRVDGEVRVWRVVSP